MSSISCRAINSPALMVSKGYSIVRAVQEKTNTITQTQRERTVALNSLLSLSGGGRFKGVSISVVSITSYQISSSSGIRQELYDGRNVVKSLALSPIATSCIPPCNANEPPCYLLVRYQFHSSLVAS